MTVYWLNFVFLEGCHRIISVHIFPATSTMLDAYKDLSKLIWTQYICIKTCHEAGSVLDTRNVMMGNTNKNPSSQGILISLEKKRQEVRLKKKTTVKYIVG